MRTRTRIALIRKALKPIPRDGLLRLIEHIDAGKPVLMDGNVCRGRVF
jgi:hypothetical protein